MAEQLKKRASEIWVEYVLEQFNDHVLTEKEACYILDVKRSKLYELR